MKNFLKRESARNLNVMFAISFTSFTLEAGFDANTEKYHHN